MYACVFTSNKIVVYTRKLICCWLSWQRKLVELRRDPHGEEKRSLKLMRKRTTATAEPGGGGGSGSGAPRSGGSITAADIRRKVGQLSYENQEFRELLAKVTTHAAEHYCTSYSTVVILFWLYTLCPKKNCGPELWR